MTIDRREQITAETLRLIEQYASDAGGTAMGLAEDPARAMGVSLVTLLEVRGPQLTEEREALARSLRQSLAVNVRSTPKWRRVGDVVRCVIGEFGRRERAATESTEAKR